MYIIRLRILGLPKASRTYASTMLFRCTFAYPDRRHISECTRPAASDHTPAISLRPTHYFLAVAFTICQTEKLNTVAVDTECTDIHRPNKLQCSKAISPSMLDVNITSHWRLAEASIQAVSLTKAHNERPLRCVAVAPSEHSWFCAEHVEHT